MRNLATMTAGCLNGSSRTHCTYLRSKANDLRTYREQKSMLATWSAHIELEARRNSQLLTPVLGSPIGV